MLLRGLKIWTSKKGQQTVDGIDRQCTICWRAGAGAATTQAINKALNFFIRDLFTRCRGYQTNFFRSVMISVFKNHIYTNYIWSITFIFVECPRSFVTVIPDKHAWCDSKNQQVTFAQSKFPLTEKLINGDLVNLNTRRLIRFCTIRYHSQVIKTQAQCPTRKQIPLLSIMSVAITCHTNNIHPVDQMDIRTPLL